LDDIDANADDHSFMLQVKRISQITFLSAPFLDAIPGVVHAFSTRRAEHNEFTLGPDSSTNPIIPMNRARFLAAAGMPGWPLLKLKQTHSDIVHSMTDTWAANEPLEGDAAITDLRGAVLGVQTADCVPILVADRAGRVIAAIHAGWRGTAAQIAYKTVTRLVEEYRISPSDLIAAIGPHNAVCCYEVGEDVVDAVADPEAFQKGSHQSKPHFDQALANKRQLLRVGIPDHQILVSTLCTQCRADLFFSHRRERARSGRLLSVIGLLP
jgi:YfiH family protein